MIFFFVIDPSIAVLLSSNRRRVAATECCQTDPQCSIEAKAERQYLEEKLHGRLSSIQDAEDSAAKEPVRSLEEIAAMLAKLEKVRAELMEDLSSQISKTEEDGMFEI